MSEALVAARARLDQWLEADALPLWWRAGADLAGGGFHEGLNLDGTPVLANRRARVQARQTYVYATAGRLGWQGPWREAVDHGLNFLLQRYRRPDGLIRTLVAADGSPVDETAVVYDQAFTLFALAAAKATFPERADLEPTARALLDRLIAERRHPVRGLIEAGDQPYQSNCHMHLLEASLAWAEISADPVWNTLADEIANLALDRFIDAKGGFLREFFGPDWLPKAGDDGRLVEPGHQFEWAWLMGRWAALRGSARAKAAAERLLAVGLGGVDPGRGVAVNALWDDLTVRDAQARLWPQTERLKAAVTLMPNDDAEIVRAIDGLMKYFDTPVAGLWRDKLKADGEFVIEFAPASSFYHIICAVEVLRGLKA